MLAWSSGSITPPSMPRTASTVGGAPAVRSAVGGWSLMVGSAPDSGRAAASDDE